MENRTLEKPSLEALLDQDLRNLIQCLAHQAYRSYTKYGSHSATLSHEDLMMEAYVGVVLAYESFDPNRGATPNIAQSFRTHAFLYIKNAIQTYCRKFCHPLSISEKNARTDLDELSNIGIVHIDQLDNEDDEFDIPVGSGVQSPEDMDDYFFMGFNDFERRMIRDHILNDYSLSEISDRHGISKSRAGEIIRNLMERVKTRAKIYVEKD